MKTTQFALVDVPTSLTLYVAVKCKHTSVQKWSMQVYNSQRGV